MVVGARQTRSKAYNKGEGVGAMDRNTAGSRMGSAVEAIPVFVGVVREGVTQKGQLSKDKEGKEQVE